MMTTQILGRGNLTCTRLAYGCARLAGTFDPAKVTPEAREKGKRALLAAYEAGYTLFDTADVYCRGVCESILGQTLGQVSGMRQRILIATKCAVRPAGTPAAGAPYRYDFSAEHIVASCEASLKRLGIETIDLYQLHRPDYLMDPGEVAGAFNRLRGQGKVREFGVSNFSPSQFDALQRACSFPLVVNQVEISLARVEAFEDGTLDQCLREGVTPLAWSPLAGGPLGAGAVVRDEQPARERLERCQKALDAVAAGHGTGRDVIALTWLLKHPAGIVPIVGSTDPGRICSAIAADGIELSREEWYTLLEASRGERLA